MVHCAYCFHLHSFALNIIVTIEEHRFKKKKTKQNSCTVFQVVARSRIIILVAKIYRLLFAKNCSYLIFKEFHEISSQY